MINFERVSKNLAAYKDAWSEAKPFSHVVIDDFITREGALRVQEEFPDPGLGEIGQSRDYIFAKNKYEKSSFWSFGPACNELFDELKSSRFAALLKEICGRDVWVDSSFHGGGMHQGGQGSFLDMHTDFNVHPLKESWFRDLNILIYLNPNWHPKWGGALKLKHRISASTAEIDPVFGRCIIMKTRDYTLHGYDPINFPLGEYRRSIACYAYSELRKGTNAKSTSWYPSGQNPAKRILGRLWPHLVIWKNHILGSSTAKNR
ncbi:MAG TPA: 2OG-Fe(II) oxygenase [Gammaproteobacteria bacterium]|nr:2OG-Fe(II) oxygenase [Gammaproteobacteria bacterium]